MTELTARFQVDGWDERTLEGLDGGWVGAVEMRKKFSSGLLGSSVALFVSSGEVEGARSYFAAERITAALEDGGYEGSLTVHHGGLESSPETWFGHIVPQSGSGPFADWSGAARIVHDENGAFFVFSLD